MAFAAAGRGSNNPHASRVTEDDMTDEAMGEIDQIVADNRDVSGQQKKGRYTLMLNNVLEKQDTMTSIQMDSASYMRKNAKYVSCFMVVLLLLSGTNFALTLMANEMSKETHVASGTLTDTGGQVVQVSSTDIGVRPADEAANARRLSTSSESGGPLELTGSGGQALYVNTPPRVLENVRVDFPTRRLSEHDDDASSAITEVCTPCDAVHNMVAAFKQGSDTYVALTIYGSHRFTVKHVTGQRVYLISESFNQGNFHVVQAVLSLIPHESDEDGNKGECCGDISSSFEAGDDAGSGRRLGEDTRRRDSRRRRRYTPRESEEYIETGTVPKDFDGQVCFPADARVRLVDGTTKAMKELGSGDEVETSANLQDVGFERWVFDFHGIMGDKQATVEAEFIEISHEASPIPLRITAKHFLFAAKPHGGAPALVLAGDVSAGDMLLISNGTTLAPAIVMDIQLVAGLGIYAPLTFSGRLVVDNVLVSSYAAPSHAAAQAWKLFPTLPWESVFWSFCAPFCYYQSFTLPAFLSFLSEWSSLLFPSQASVDPSVLAAGRVLDATLVRWLLRFGMRST